MRAEADRADALGEALAGANNVLVMAPALGDDADESCSGLLAVEPAADTDVLCVTFNETPDARLEAWRRTGGPTEPANLGFLVVGDGMRSAAAATAPSGPSPNGVGPRLASLANPGDLTGLGIELGDCFAEWADSGNRLHLCFHTLTTLLQYADLRSVYRFLHVLTGRVRVIDGVAHYHLDPAAHDERTVNVLLGLFDAAVEPGPEGGWRIMSRR